MLYGAFQVKRGSCCRCGATGRPLYVMQCEPGRVPRLDDAAPGAPDASACSECWQEVSDVITVRFAVAAG